MQEHARGLVDSLARDHKVVVFVSEGHRFDARHRNITIKPVMRWQLDRDLPELERTKVDAWITLNAGLAPYSIGLSAPVFAYLHGNDFTKPWHPHPNRRVRVASRFCGESVVRHWRTRQIAAGLRGARWMFANSAFSRGLCSRMYGVPQERITVVAPGMRPEFFRATEPAGSPAGSPVGSPTNANELRLVTVSRLASNAERKNVDAVIEAVAQLRDEIDIRYTIIGDGDDLARLRTLADDLGVSGSVDFLGAVDTQAVIDQFGRSDAFVMAVKPNEGDVEGFGMVYAEAAASGLPSIGTDIGGIPEVIENGVTGILLDDVSAGGIANGVRRFHHNRSDFDPDTIRAKAERFAAPSCADQIAETIVSMI